jgi:hypothetical protein
MGGLTLIYDRLVDRDGHITYLGQPSIFGPFGRNQKHPFTFRFDEFNRRDEVSISRQ